MLEHANALPAQIYTFDGYIETLVVDTASMAQQRGGRASEEVMKVDKLAKGLALNSVILMEAQKLIEQSEGMSAEQLVKKLESLEEKRKAGNLGVGELKTCEAYSAFAEQFVEGDGDDEIVCSSAGVAPSMKDPFSQMDYAVEDGRYPVALSCKHVYNWQTVAAKKGNGDWQLVKCAVAGCRGGANGGCGSAPSTLEARKALKEDPRIKNLLQKKAQPGGKRQRASMEAEELDD